MGPSTQGVFPSVCFMALFLLFPNVLVHYQHANRAAFASISSLHAEKNLCNHVTMTILY